MALQQRGYTGLGKIKFGEHYIYLAGLVLSVSGQDTLRKARLSENTKLTFNPFVFSPCYPTAPENLTHSLS